MKHPPETKPIILVCLIARPNENKTLLNKLIIIGTNYNLDFHEEQQNWLLFMLYWIVRLYHRIAGRIEEETEKSRGTFWWYILVIFKIYLFVQPTRCFKYLKDFSCSSIFGGSIL